MACVLEAHQPAYEPIPSTRASGRRRWNAPDPARLAGVLLLMVWVGPVTFAQTDSWQLLGLMGAPGRALAESQLIPAGKAMLLEPGMSLKLRLRDGRVLEGRLLGRVLLDSALYAQRFAAHARSSSYVPLVLGETLHVSLRDGRQWSAPFAGYGEMTLLLQGHDEPPYVRVPFEFASEVRRAPGDRVDLGELARACRADLLPSAEALALETRHHPGHTGDPWAGALQVPVQDVEAAILTMPKGPGRTSLSAGDVAGIVVLSVVVSVVLFYVLLTHSLKSASNSCRSNPNRSAQLAGAHLTTRPFDRYRGCYVGEALAVADPWPGPNGGGPATELTDLARSPVMAR